MDIDELHNKGLLPDRYYYQMNNRTGQENYKMQRNRNMVSNPEETEIKDLVENELDKILSDLFKDFTIK